MTPQTAALTASMEDYLEAIFQIAANREVARVKQIAEALGVRMASVTGALRTLADKGLVAHDKFGDVALTPRGTELARRIVRRHDVLTSFLVDVLGVERDTAEGVACKMEHSVGKVVTDRLVRFADFLQTCPRAGTDWLSKFHEACGHDTDPARCEECLRRCQASRAGSHGDTGAPAERALSDLALEERGMVVGVKGRGPIKRRLMDMGLVPGSVVETIQVAPLGDPIEIKLKGYRLALRKDEAARVVVRPL